jgi:hypothetical protein
MSELWCVNIVGPDAVHACMSKEQAEGLAANINLRFKPLADELDVLYEARVIPWPWSAALHCSDYQSTLSGWGDLVPQVSQIPAPSGDVGALATDLSAVSTSNCAAGSSGSVAAFSDDATRAMR